MFDECPGFTLALGLIQWSGKGIDDTGGGAPHPGIERREQAGGTAADDGYVLQLLLGHCSS